MRDQTRVGRFTLGFVSLLALTSCSGGDSGKSAEATAAAREPAAAEGRNLEETQGIVLLRGLPTLETRHSVAVVELDPEVQYAGREAGLKWAEGIAAENAWFKRVLDHQEAFAELWGDAHRYRTVKVRDE